jgi:hypothetical protein
MAEAGLDTRSARQSYAQLLENALDAPPESYLR